MLQRMHLSHLQRTLLRLHKVPKPHENTSMRGVFVIHTPLTLYNMVASELKYIHQAFMPQKSYGKNTLRNQKETRRTIFA